MQYRQLGSSGLKLSAIGLGTNAFGKRSDAAVSTNIIHAAIDAGITFIDTANIYASTQSEQIIGQALQGRRHEVVLTTKAGLPSGQGPYERGSSRRYIMGQLEASLKRLQTDYVDLYQIHTFDPHTPLDETLRALEDMIRAGKIRYIGCSNYYAWELMKALSISDKLGIHRYISHQVSYSLADRTPERELIPLCEDQGVGIIPYFPLAGGILTGKYNDPKQFAADSRAKTDPNFNRFIREDTIALSKGVSKLADELQTEAGTLSLAWLLQQKIVSSIIVGATKAEHIAANIKAMELQLAEDTMEQLAALSEPFRHGEPFAMYRLS